jgi:hypothetical protein
LASEGRSTIRSIWSVYIDLSDLLSKVKSREGDYSTYDMYIINAFQSKKVKDKFEKYHGYISNSPIYFISSVLDPCIKGTLIQSDYSDGDSKLADIRKTLHKLYPAQKPTVDSNISLLSHTWESCLLQKVHKTTTPVSDIDRYFNSPVVDWDSGNDSDWVLKWWRANEGLYPLMSQAARDYLGVQAGEVDCERLFCEGCDLIGL